MSAVSIPEEMALEARLRSRRAGGAKLLVPYVTAGLTDDWVRVVEAVAAAGADAIEIGIPFSDPIIDGPVIQAASQTALERGVTPASALAELGEVSVGVPLVAMTYCNLLFHAGFHRYAGWLEEAGVAGTIFPDLPKEEAGPWAEFAAGKGIANVLLVAPTTSEDRARAIAAESRGFVYGVGLMGVTGVREQLAASAIGVAKRLKSVTDRPVLIGVGVSSPLHARQLAPHADGVVVGSALVKILADGGGPEGAYDFVSSLRQALDGQ
ncbi:MAG: tryptophan synthase subunit alpha [Actinomycetota bacterium]|nr:tryptophan synthase subunit alpha [Actinomycetota bacterium]